MARSFLSVVRFVRFEDAYAHPRCFVALSDGFAFCDAGTEAAVDFADGSTSRCVKLDSEPDFVAIRVAAYQTAMGTYIGERDWLLAAHRGAWGVVRRLKLGM